MTRTSSTERAGRTSRRFAWFGVAVLVALANINAAPARAALPVQVVHGDMTYKSGNYTISFSAKDTGGSQVVFESPNFQGASPSLLLLDKYQAGPVTFSGPDAAGVCHSAIFKPVPDLAFRLVLHCYGDYLGPARAFIIRMAGVVRRDPGLAGRYFLDGVFVVT